MQACLARLYVDEPFRRWLLAERAAALEGYFLSPDERAALLSIDSGQLDDFAASLVAKRRKRVEHAYPMLFALDTPILRRCYSRFHHLFPSRPGDAPEQDILAFGTFMQETLPAIDLLPPYASDLAKYERLCFVALGAGLSTSPPAEPQLLTSQARPFLHPAVRLAEFDYDVADFESRLGVESGASPPALDPSACCVLFHRAALDGSLQMLRINAPTRKIIMLCDASRSTDQVIAAAEASLGAYDLADGVVQAIERLLRAGVLILSAPDPASAGRRPKLVVDAGEGFDE